MRRRGTSTTSAHATRHKGPSLPARGALAQPAPVASGCRRGGTVLSSASGGETRAGARPSYSTAMDGLVLGPGEGETLFGGRIVLKATFEQLCITESLFPDARDGAEPHFHRRHADSFYVLEGGLAVLVHDEEKLLEPGAFVTAPPEVVHGFRSTSRARFLNFHTPDGRFADNLRERDRGEPGGFDSIDAPPGSGKPPTDAVFLPPGGGERLEGNSRVATIKVGRDELALIEFELQAGFDGPDPHSH